MWEYDTRYVHNNDEILKTENFNIKHNLKNIIHSLDFCGICLVEDVNIVSLDDVLSDEEYLTIKEMVKEAFGEQLLTNITNYFVCKNCKQQILESYKFVLKIKLSSVMLNHYLEQIETHLQTVDEMLLRTDKCDFENTVVVLHDFFTREEILDPNEHLKTELLSDSDVCSDVSYSHNGDHFNTYICEHCNRKFKSRYLITKHLINRHNIVLSKSKLTCPECTECPCPHEKYLVAVKIQLDLGAKLFNCIECSYVAQTKGSMIAHANKEHLKLQPYLCESCGQTFHSKKLHSHHMKQYHDVSLCCDYCERKFQDQTLLKQHIESCKTITREFKCPTCPASFLTLEEYNLHSTKHRMLFSCDMCSKKCKSEAFLMRHKYNTHCNNIHNKNKRKKMAKDEKPRVCSICPLVLSSLAELKEHLNTHSPSEKHKCTLCNKEFDTRRQYNMHVSTWSHLHKVDPKTQFNFRCTFPNCNYSGKSKIVIENHKNTCHLKIKPYVCNLCNKQFTTSISLKYHIERHEGVRRFQCSVCSNLFTSASGLKKHYLRHHSDKRPIKCDLCPKSFVCQSEYDLHYLRNHSEKSVSCPLCESKFHCNTNLRGHIRKVHFKGKLFNEILATGKVSQDMYEIFRDHRLAF